jgi:hypothetical protein
MGKKTVGFLVSLVTVLALTNGGCAGGCYTYMETLRIDPATSCLALHPGQDPNDKIACGLPELGGTNDCSEPLTLPKRNENDTPVVIAPGGKVFWMYPDKSMAPDITVTGDNDGRVYTVIAMLGTQRITLTLPTHETE